MYLRKLVHESLVPHNTLQNLHVLCRHAYAEVEIFAGYALLSQVVPLIRILLPARISKFFVQVITDFLKLKAHVIKAFLYLAADVLLDILHQGGWCSTLFNHANLLLLLNQLLERLVNPIDCLVHGDILLLRQLHLLVGVFAALNSVFEFQSGVLKILVALLDALHQDFELLVKMVSKGLRDASQPFVNCGLQLGDLADQLDVVAVVFLNVALNDQLVNKLFQLCVNPFQKHNALELYLTEVRVLLNIPLVEPE